MEDKNFYIPPFEDLKVGYQCWTRVEPYPDWVFSTLDDGDDIQFVMDKVWEIKTQYLSSLDLEVHGWIQEDNIGGFPAFRKGTETSYHQIRFLDNILEISDHTGERRNPLYFGKCPSVNEFRTICKLLEIH